MRRLFKKNAEEKVNLPNEDGVIRIPEGTKTIERGAFSFRDDIRKVIIPEGVTKIEFGAFYACRNLEDIYIPDTVEIIEEEAFASCSKLNWLCFPDGVKELSRGVCQNCSGMENVEVSESLEYISKSAFMNCGKLLDIFLDNAECVIENNAFDGCDIIHMYAPEGSFAEWYGKKLEYNRRYSPRSLVKRKKPLYAFISYSIKNHEAAVLLSKELKTYGIDTQMIPGDIAIDDKYREALDDAIKNSGYIILMYSKNANNSRWIAGETERAIRLQKIIIPVQIEELFYELRRDQNQKSKLIVEDFSPGFEKIVEASYAFLDKNPNTIKKPSKTQSEIIKTPKKERLSEAGFELELSFRYTGYTYFRHFEKDLDTEYRFAPDEAFNKRLTELLNTVYCAVFGIDDLTMQIKWLGEKEDYLCERMPDSEYKNRGNNCRGEFKITCLEQPKSANFDSFEIGIRSNDFYIFLYKQGTKSGYAYCGIDPDTPLSYFGIDEQRLVAAAKELIAFARPHKKLTFSDNFRREDSSIENSGAVYNRLRFIAD